MNGGEIAGVITAASVLILGLLTAIGKGASYIITLIMNSYKSQVESTENAKDAEIRAKDESIAELKRRIERHMEELAYHKSANSELRHGNNELIAENSSLHKQLSNLRDQAIGGTR